MQEVAPESSCAISVPHAHRRHSKKDKGTSNGKPPEKHREEKKRRRAVKELLARVVENGTTAAAGLTPEALICSYPRFIAPDKMLRTVERSVLHELDSSPQNVLALVRLLGVWIRLRGGIDFRRGSARLADLMKLISQLAIRIPKSPRMTSFDDTGDSPLLLIALNRIKLSLIAALVGPTGIPALVDSKSSPLTLGQQSVTGSIHSAAVKAQRTSMNLKASVRTPQATQRSTSLLIQSGSHHQVARVQHNPISVRRTATKLFSFTPTQIAEALTYIDHQLFASVPLEEFLEKRWEHTTVPSKLRSLIERSNNLSEWVASHILVQGSIASQTHVVQLFIEVCKWCEALGNYYACSGIFGGFNKWFAYSSSIFRCISRLTRTWKIKHSHKLLHAYVHQVVSEDKNYAMYRGLLADRLQSGKACIPHIAVILRDLTFIEDGNLDFVNEQINAKKISLIGVHIEQIRTIQLRQLPLLSQDTDPLLLDRLLSLPHRDDAWLEKRSKELRPMLGTTASGEDLSFASASTKSNDDSSCDESGRVLEDVVDLSDISSHSGNSTIVTSP